MSSKLYTIKKILLFCENNIIFLIIYYFEDIKYRINLFVFQKESGFTQ